jgi:lipid-A-disaccharide synthase
LTSSKKTLRIGIVAGEPSGDLLGAGLLQALRKSHPNIQAEGVAGSQMQAAGCVSLFPIESISVMGLAEVIRHIPTILYTRHQLTKHFLQNPPDVFIGIDAPDFNLTLEEKLKQAGIPTVHYVSPSVWAWRRGRLKKIKRPVDLMLTLLPFEKRFYDEAHIAAKFVGHPLADSIALENDRTVARHAFGLDENATIIALLPGSRTNEIHYLAELFIRTAIQCQRKYPNLIFIAPMVNRERREQFTAIWQRLAPQLSIQVVEGQAQQAMAAANVILLASGTATLEALLVKRPMVVAYRLSPLSYFIARYLVNVSRVALPNLLTDNVDLVPEFIQQNATVENLSAALLNYLENPQLQNNLYEEFTRIHNVLRRDANQQAAAAVLELVNN